MRRVTISAFHLMTKNYGAPPRCPDCGDMNEEGRPGPYCKEPMTPGGHYERQEV